MSVPSLLTTRRFLPLFITQFMGAFNDNAFKNALLIMLTYGALSAQGIESGLLVIAAAGVFILPFFLFSATAGQLADKYNKASIIRAVKIAECVLMLTAAYGFYTANVFILMTVLFLLGVHSAFFGPVKYSIVPQHVQPNDLVAANGLLEAGTFLAILAGTIVSGVLVMQESGSIIISALTIFAALVGLAFGWAVPPAQAGAPDLKISPNIARTTWHVLAEVRTNRDVYLSILGISWFWLIGFVMLAQFPAFARDILGGDESVVTLLLVVFSIGTAIGSIMCSKILKGQVSGIYVPAGGFTMTAALLVIYAGAMLAPAVGANELTNAADILQQTYMWVVLAGLLLLAMAGGVYVVPLYAIMQVRCDATHRARTIAANNIVNALFMVLASIAVAGLNLLGLSVIDIFVVMAVINIPIALIVRKVVHTRRAHRLQKEA